VPLSRVAGGGVVACAIAGVAVLLPLLACGPATPAAGAAVDDYVAAPGTSGDPAPPTTPSADASSDASADAASADAATCTTAAPFRCADDGASRASCASGIPTVEPCPRGCLRETGSSEDVCMGTTTTWSCPGSYGTTKARNGDYYVTAFGCWKDAQGASHGDGQDNCIPSCLAQAKSAGLCLAGDTGKQCEERVTWYTADAARFGCLARLRVTNPANGKSVIAVALDFGPSCSAVESKVQKAVLDASGRVDRQLFGSDQGVLDRSLVHVVEVAASTPLGPTSP
jgi:hypothetical protein